MKETISASEARRIALTAQGFNAIARAGIVGTSDLKKTIRQLNLLQIDSVNVLIRAHYVPLYSRLGPYHIDLLDELVNAKPKRYFEYWGHEASLLPVEFHPLLRWRMADAYKGKGIWQQLQPYAAEKRAEAKALLKRIEKDGPLAASDIAGSKGEKGMWVWSNAKHAMEWLFWAGLVSAKYRRGSFERVYDLPGRVLPRSVLNMPTPTEVDARRILLGHAARALGIATEDDLRDYFRISPANAKLPMQQLIEEGSVVPVQVAGWKQQAYLSNKAVAGRRTYGAALLSPFDPLIWNRRRTERLFNFRYRLEIYRPAHLREHGYYVLPFLLDGAIVARVDLKADRKNGILVVRRIGIESDAPEYTIDQLKQELELMASWLGLTAIKMSNHMHL